MTRIITVRNQQWHVGNISLYQSAYDEIRMHIESKKTGTHRFAENLRFSVLGEQFELRRARIDFASLRAGGAHGGVQTPHFQDGEVCVALNSADTIQFLRYGTLTHNLQRAITKQLIEPKIATAVRVSTPLPKKISKLIASFAIDI